MALQKKKSVKLSVADLLAFAGVALTDVTVDLGGSDDGCACTLHGKDKDGDDALIVFSKLPYDHTEDDVGGASCGLLKSSGGAFLLAGLPVVDKADRHEDGRPGDHVLARIKLDRAAASPEFPVVLAFTEVV